MLLFLQGVCVGFFSLSAFHMSSFFFLFLVPNISHPAGTLVCFNLLPQVTEAGRSDCLVCFIMAKPLVFGVSTVKGPCHIQATF